MATSIETHQSFSGFLTFQWTAQVNPSANICWLDFIDSPWFWVFGCLILAQLSPDYPQHPIFSRGEIRVRACSMSCFLQCCLLKLVTCWLGRWIHPVSVAAHVGSALESRDGSIFPSIENSVLSPVYRLGDCTHYWSWWRDSVLISPGSFSRSL